MTKSELVTVVAEVHALQLRDEETRGFPRSVVTVAVDRRHSPEIHVSNLEGVGAGHVENTVAGGEIVVNTGVNVHFAEAEILVGGEFKQHVIARGGCSPVQRGLGVSRKVVPCFVPDGQPLCRVGQGHGGGRCSAAPLVGERERGLVARRCGFSRVKHNALAAGVGLKLAPHGHEHVKRRFVTSVKVILHRMVQVEGEGVAALVAFGQGKRCGTVGATTVVPLHAVGGHDVPGHFVFNPNPGLFHAVEGNHRVAAVGGTDHGQFGIDDGEVVVKAELVQRGSQVDESFLARRHAGFGGHVITVGDGFANFAHGGVLEKVLFESRVVRCDGQGGGAVTVVHDIEGGKEETRFFPVAPLVVGVNRTDTHVHGGSVGQGKGGGERIRTCGSRGAEGGPKGGKVPVVVTGGKPIGIVAELHFDVLTGV